MAGIKAEEEAFKAFSILNRIFLKNSRNPNPYRWEIDWIEGTELREFKAN
jgi:hypothetical protein